MQRKPEEKRHDCTCDWVWKALLADLREAHSAGSQWQSDEQIISSENLNKNITLLYTNRYVGTYNADKPSAKKNKN